ncbi:MAG TPA: hypothetical protein VN634_04325 [Candidatus Limnocylindrales bacterium]|nr:hypothetical protein [Candidatus Limnocylindrales bacterium]
MRTAQIATHESIPRRVSSRTMLVPALALLLTLDASTVFAQDGGVTFSPYLMTRPPVGSTSDDALIHGISRKIAPRLKASYGLGLAEETDLTSAFLRYDQTLAYGTRSDPGSRENWRHFLGLEYSPFRRFSLVGGIAKAGGLRGGFSPTGYERLRLNTGLRWAGENWGLDGSFSYIPTGTSHYPGDAGYMPGPGSGSNPTYFFSLSVTRRF